MQPIPKHLLNLAVVMHLEHGLKDRAAMLCKAVPTLRFYDPRAVYRVVNPLLKRADELARQSHYVGAPMTKEQAYDTLRNEYPDLEEEVMKRLMDYGYWCCAKG